MQPFPIAAIAFHQAWIFLSPSIQDYRVFSANIASIHPELPLPREISHLQGVNGLWVFWKRAIDFDNMTNISNLNLSKGTIPPLLKYKIVFLGDQAVGKSSIINRFIYDIFDGNEHRPTIGIDFISQNIFLQDKTIRLQLWDTAGQQRFKALIPNYIRDTSVAVIVYDVTNRNSFNSVQKWIDDVKYQRGDGVIIALLANKVDLEERDVSNEQGKQLAHRNQILFKEVSAKTGANIQEFFKEIAAQLPEVNQPTSRSKAADNPAPAGQNREQSQHPSNNIVLVNPKEIEKKAQKSKMCC